MARQLEIRAPAEQTEGTRSQILRWLKSIGDVVVENEPLIEIETDKVTVEVAAPGSGTLRQIVKQEQEEIAPGDLLGTIETSAAGAGSGARTTGAGLPPTAGANPQATADVGLQASGAASPQASAGASPQASAGADTPANPSLSDAGRLRATAAAGGDSSDGVHALASALSPTAPSPAAEGLTSPAGPNGAASRQLSPAVRRLLSERGLDPSEVLGTGQGGRITVSDVLNHSAETPRHTGTTAGGSASAGSPARGASLAHAANAASLERATTVAAGLGPSHRVPHTVTRKRIAEHMVQSLLRTAPHVTTIFEADLTAVLEHRQRNKDEFARRGAQLTLTAYFLQAAVAAIRAVPEANSRWADDALEVFDSVHIGVATALDTGLVVPVLRDVQARDLFETARGLEDLVSRARQGRLSPADVRGGTFTISNHGVSGSLVATPIVINQPQAAILGVGKLEKRPVVVSENGEDRLAIRPQCYVTLTIDHRVMDGHQANRFLQTFVQWLGTSAGG